MVVRDAIQEGNTRKASTIKRMLKANLNREAGEKSFSARVLRIFITEKMLCLEAKIPKKKPLMIYKSELMIWLKLFMMLPPVFTVKLIITALTDMDKRAGRRWLSALVRCPADRHIKQLFLRRFLCRQFAKTETKCHIYDKIII